MKNFPSIALATWSCKGTLSIIGVTKPKHVEEADAASKIILSTEEISQMEEYARRTGVDTKESWGNYMS